MTVLDTETIKSIKNVHFSKIWDIVLYGLFK